MSVHRDCGEEIVWVKNENDPNRWMPPLEFAGYRHIITTQGDDQFAVQMPTYIRHHCDPDRMKAWQDYQVRIAALKENAPDVTTGMTPRQAKHQQLVEQAWEYALKFKCPRVGCEAEATELCVNLAEKKRGRSVPTKNPHPERLDPDLTRFERSVFDKGKE